MGTLTPFTPPLPPPPLPTLFLVCRNMRRGKNVLAFKALEEAVKYK